MQGADVLGWIAKVFGGNEIEVPEGTPAKWVAHLETLLVPLDGMKAGRSGLARDIVTYVLTGEPLSILNEAGQRDCVGEHLGTSGYRHLFTGKKEATTLYDEIDQVPPAQLVRWAKLLEATTKVNPLTYGLQLPNGIHWPEALVLHAAGVSTTVWSSDDHEKKSLLFAEAFERLLQDEGLDPASLLVAAFATPVLTVHSASSRAKVVSNLKGYWDAVDRHLESLRPHLLPAAAQQRLHVLQMLTGTKPETLARIAGELAELVTSNSKQVRAAAEPLVRRCGIHMVPPLKELAQNGKPEQRANALQLLWSIARQHTDPSLQAYAREIAAADKAPSVSALVQQWESSDAADAEAKEQSYEYEVPKIDWSNSLTPQVSALLDQLWDNINASIRRLNRQLKEHYDQHIASGGTAHHKLHQHPEYPPTGLKALKDYLSSPSPAKAPTIGGERRDNWQHIGSSTEWLAKQPGITPQVVLKIMASFGILTDYVDALSHPVAQAINALYRIRRRPTLIELGEMIKELGLPEKVILKNYVSPWGTTIAKGWDVADVWPFFAHNESTLIQMLQNRTKDFHVDRRALYRAVATMPKPPAQIVNTLYDVALGTGKSDRLMAQMALENHPNKEARIINALSDGKADVRAAAATWLGRMRHEPAIPQLESAIAKEKQDVPKGAMLDALQAMGQPVEKYLDRKALEKEAQKSLAKGVPKELDWFPWSAMPPVHWSDSGNPIPTDVLRWLLVQAVKQKTPEPNAVLRKYCTMFAPRDREALGQFVLDAWLFEDVKPISQENAIKGARAQAQQMHAFMQQHPQFYKNDPNVGKSVDELYATYLPMFLRQPAGSATSTKGLLAVVAACAAERAAASVGRYLKEYYGTRAAQGKALIAMLAWIEHPSATQLMLSVGNRFRTKSFQEEATRQAEALAERKGWTLAELADRTIPSAGFDETGALELNYGMRAFTARLLPDFKIELFNPEGKKITSLPEPRQDDDATLAKDAKKAFSNAKKEIKNIVTLQTERLYEALCTERDWPFEDWSRYLLQHPVMRHLVQRLVWTIVADGKTVGTFRPLDDGTLTDREDNPVTPAADTRVRVAHDTNLSAEEVAQWQQHLADYEIAPLFQQFGKGSYTLPKDKEDESSINEFEGYLIEAYALRGRALKLGYTRGSTEDGGWFFHYEKRFPTLGFVAVIEFTGNPLPEQNRTVALITLSFSSTQDGGQRSSLSLSDVPKVLLSECYNDLRLIAGEGTGFDPDWRKKTEF